MLDTISGIFKEPLRIILYCTRYIYFNITCVTVVSGGSKYTNVNTS